RRSTTPVHGCEPGWETTMTDEQLDARLRAAGEAWRAANDPSIAVPSGLDEPLMPPGRSHPHGPRRTAVFAAAAVVTAALVAGAGFLLSGGNTHKRATDAAATPLE